MNEDEKDIFINCSKIIKQKNAWQEPYFITEILFKYHFDVFGLIEQNLAIDVNTLKL